MVSVADVGVPRIGVISVGLVPKTFSPVPVDVVRALSKFALDGVVRNVDTPDAGGRLP